MTEADLESVLERQKQVLLFDYTQLAKRRAAQRESMRKLREKRKRENGDQNLRTATAVHQKGDTKSGN